VGGSRLPGYGTLLCLISEAYGATARCFLPFLGGWLVEMGMPDNAQMRHIARLACKGMISNEQGLEMHN
jgi:hypothetical protein